MQDGYEKQDKKKDDFDKVKDSNVDNAMYDAKDVMKLAIKDLYNSKKDISCYGFVNRTQKLLTKILPHKLVMKIWINQQKLDGTPNIRK